MTNLILKRLAAVFALLLCTVLLSQCNDSTGPAPVERISIFSGDNQFWLRGTEMPAPLVVSVRTALGVVPENATVKFKVLMGDGSLSKTSVLANSQGFASTRLTLGAQVGLNQVRATVENGGASVIFEATASNFYCPEGEDTLRICDRNCPTKYGPKGELFLVTQKSALYSSAGVVRVSPFGVPQSAFGFREIPPEFFVQPVIFDGAFSPRGDYYVSRSIFFPEVIQISTIGEITRLAGLEARSEIALNPIGLLVGCDTRGPFFVDCRDMLIRFSEATFVDGINDDALCVDPRKQSDDPLGGDIYFINQTDVTLYRLAVDSVTVEPRGLETVASLTQDEADHCNGMACDKRNGNVYLLVDSKTTKQLIEVTPGGVKTTLFDFYVDRGPDSLAAGVQRDLAIDPPRLYTIDTENNKLLVYDLAGVFNQLFSDSLEQVKLSTVSSIGERIGLSVLK